MLGHMVLAIFTLQAPFTPATATPPRPATEAQDAMKKPWPPEGVYRAKEVTPPRLIKEAKPLYTSDAMRARIQGVVTLEAIVGRDGNVAEVRVKQSLDREHGLDDEAMKAVKKWRFTPGMKDGAPVPVLVEIDLTFTLRN